MTIYEVWQEIKNGFKTTPIQETKPMMDDLKSLFKKEVSLLQTTKISAAVINLIAEYNDNNASAPNKKNAFIDCIIAMLEEEKTTVPPASK